MQTRHISTDGIKIVTPWMLGKHADFIYFFLPVIFGLSLFFLSESALVSKSVFWAIMLATGMAIGPFHQGPTLFTYFDEGNRRYFFSSAKNLLCFGLMPLLLIAVSVSAAFVCPFALFIIVSLWHIQHLVQQNVRVLDIYHGGKSLTNEALPDRELSATTQWGAAIVCTLMSCSRTNFLGLKVLPGLDILIGALCVWLLIRCAQYLMHLSVQVKAGAALNMPALALWFVGLFSMLPVAFMGKDFFAPFLVPLMIHWIQFIGMNIYLTKRKYVEQKVCGLPGSHPLAFLLIFCLAYTLVYVALQRIADPSAGSEYWRTIALGLTMGLGMCHYFLDTYIWRFDQQFQKEAFLSYLQKD